MQSYSAVTVGDTLVLGMNPNAKEFTPNHTESFYLPVEQLSQRQVKLLQELIVEWITIPTWVA